MNDHPANPNALPKYVQISELLIRDIAAGRLMDGERLAPEREMAESLATSVGTLRKALAILEEKGIDVSTLIEAYIPDENDLAERLSERDEMVQRIFRSFVRRPTDSTALDADAPSLRDITD